MKKKVVTIKNFIDFQKILKFWNDKLDNKKVPKSSKNYFKKIYNENGKKCFKISIKKCYVN